MPRTVLPGSHTPIPSNATEIAIVGKYEDLVADGISLDEPGLLTAADLPGDITNRDLQELLVAQAIAEEGYQVS